MDSRGNEEPPSEPMDRFIYDIARDEPYRVITTSLMAAKRHLQERFVKSGVFTFLTRDEHRVLDALIELINLDHWKASGGEMFAFPKLVSLEKVCKLGFRNARRNLIALARYGLIKLADREIFPGQLTEGYLLIPPSEKDSIDWTNHFNRRGNAKRDKKAFADHPKLFPEPESPMTPAGVADDSPLESPMTPTRVTDDSEHNKDRACAPPSKRIDYTTTSKPQSGDAGGGVEIGCADKTAARRVLVDLGIGGKKLRQLLAMETTTYTAARAAVLHAKADPLVKNPRGLVIWLLEEPAERISQAAIDQAERLIHVARQQADQATTTPIEPRARQIIADASDELLRSMLDDIASNPPQGNAVVANHARRATVQFLRDSAPPFLTQIVAQRIAASTQNQGAEHAH